MINRAKQRYIAYVFVAITFVFIVFSLAMSQKEHSESNWYATVRPGDKPFTYIFYPNIPYTINSDDYIIHFGFMTKKECDPFVEEYSENYSAPQGLENYLGCNRPLCLKKFNITCKDTTYFTLTVNLSGFIYESGHYEIHKGISEGRSLYYSNKKHLFVLLKDFNGKK